MPSEKPTLKQYDTYIAGLFAAEDGALQATHHATEEGGLPKINVSATEGALLHVLTLVSGAKRILEIGTLGGYSATWLARALPAGGRLISLEIDAHHADVARANIERAGLAACVEVRVGPALESLKKMQADREPAFDAVFIDADKDGYVDYLNAALPLLRTGGLLLADNTLPDAIADPSGDTGAMRYNAAVSKHPGLVSVIVPVLREGGIDGLTVSVKR